MVRGRILLTLFVSVCAAVTVLPRLHAEKKTLAGAYIVEYQDGHNATSLAAAVIDYLSHFRLEYNLAHFKGASLQLRDNATEADAISALVTAPAVKNIWPVYVYERPHLNATEVTPSGRSVHVDTFSPHVMMQADQLRARGFDGKGVKLAVIDSGVDYTHPALGGCFGLGCKVSFGHDLVGDAFTGQNQPQPDDDPMDCGSHGTHVSGIIAADANEAGFTGVAPGVTLGMYKVFGCSGGTATDILMAAAARAANDGARIISCSVGAADGWIDDAFTQFLTRLATERSIVSTVAAGNDGSHGAFYPSGAANGAGVNSIAAVDLTETRGTGGTPSFFSSWGPTMEMSFKPQFAAPGRDILSTLPHNKYGRASGTSMSTPMAAGVIALLHQALGPVDPKYMQTLLSNTAKPLFFSDGSKTYDVLAPTAQQGAGLIQALAAFKAKTHVAPASMSFNDTAHLNSGIPVTVYNTGNTTVDYHLTVHPAVSVYVLASDGSPYPSSFPNGQTTVSGVVGASEISFTLMPREARTLSLFVISPPSSREVDTKRLVLWSGFLVIRGGGGGGGTDASAVSIPYQGLAGSLGNATTLPADGGAVVTMSSDEHHTPVAAGTVFILPGPGSAAAAASTTTTTTTTSITTSTTGEDVDDDVDWPLIMVNLALGTSTITAEIIDASSGAVLGALPGVPYHWITRGNGFGFLWDGRLAGGGYVAGGGTYKVRVQALCIFGDDNVANDWDSSDTVPFTIFYKR